MGMYYVCACVHVCDYASLKGLDEPKSHGDRRSNTLPKQSKYVGVYVDTIVCAHFIFLHKWIHALVEIGVLQYVCCLDLDL